ncbi:4-hydroxythreonine-4-phosphate dehydrogenase PdxA [Pseudobacteriovorax antillogorgiicola]|uniref:4-hydroxythreonine-4-phosphate dehydrogenase n=1 Tax=Pseudobacteriovorax antillogorgiicola TaxID=1513793 RepID=A0A1Y6BW86_9BACT|nr:4-hydroxythreonine-4-phosphate dehydrogenase PdxA [Pseudobacteriovorax antillogorgiicola]TCS53854.1 4-hydroxythreonine-4-phosphate dehydrogenase [Pseudobacteriovorax antillogorgiicola]SMF21524.1 4-hydroxythreonine-4-phosphate dehydrogenase [Pseudobacteriovorax antillogorgiicola]
MLLVTLGDPYSINIEALGELLPRIPDKVPVVLVGSFSQWEYQCQQFQISLAVKMIQSWSDLTDKGIHFLNVGPELPRVNPRELTDQQRGGVAVAALESLRSFPKMQNTAVLTCPIDKYACQQAGFRFPGQTEFFEDLAGERGVMILAGPSLRVALVTNHLALRDVAPHINESLIVKKFELFSKTLSRIFKIKSPRIAVVGLNPHCGDQGMFGDEDYRVIAPAVSRLESHSEYEPTGPIPADTAFFHGYQGRFDGILAMYHDQGLGPLKTVHFFDAVNITGGLDFLRVSPDHGPAADKFGQGTANWESFSAALTHCLRYLGYEPSTHRRD